MSSALSLPFLHPQTVEAIDYPELQAYLNELGAYLTGVISDQERDVLLEETYDHLASMIEREEENSISRQVATELALQSFGSARRNAEEMIEVWQNKQPQHESLIIRRLGLANAYAFGLFGCTNLLYWALLQFRVYLPSNAPFDLPWTPSEIRKYFPEPLPFPDFSAQFILVSVFPVLAPFVVGWMCGRSIAVRPHYTVYAVLMPIILSSFLMGLVLLPVTEGLVFAAFQALFWLPVGCLSAYLSSSFAWRSRQRKFGRAAGTRASQRTLQGDHLK